MAERNTMMVSRLNPAVPRRYLYALAGVLWTIAGGILCARAFIWLGDFPVITEVALETLSLALSLVAYFLLFSRIVQESIERIGALPERVCLFAFTPWRGYLMIVLMIGTGITLRKISIPAYYLSIPYAAMGGTLLMGSLKFYRRFLSRVL